jgi:hypothetical protein
MLVIGLGSTGSDVCDGLIERIEDIYDEGLDATPWIKFLAIETEHESSSKATARTKNFVHIGLQADRVHQAKANPQSLDQMNEFTRWSNPDTIHRWLPGPGSGNCRMIGRASLLHLDVLPYIVDAVRERLAELSQLDSQVVDLNGRERALSDRVRVFICGTLVGGTGSGGLIDLGYIIGRLNQQFDGKIETFGILAVPGSNIQNNFLKANAYQALTELSHFYFPGTKYRQKVPLSDIPSGVLAPPSGTPPFDNIFLVQPRTGFQDRQLEQLISSVIEFVFVTGTTEATSEVDARLINPGVVFQGKLDKKGRPQSFSSFGVSVIEYPIERISRGCASRLVESSLRRWLTREDYEVQVTNNQFVNRLALTPSRLTEDLTAAQEGGASFEQRIGSLMKPALDSALRNGASELSGVEVAIEVGFDEAKQSTGIVQAGEFTSQVKERGAEVVEDRLRRTRQLIEELVTDANRGANWTSETIKGIRTRLVEEERSLSTLVDSEFIETLRAEMDDHRVRFDQAHSSTFLGMLGWKGIALDRIADQYEDAAKAYWSARMQQVAANFVREVYRKLEAVLERAGTRLDDPEYGLKQWVDQIASMAADQHVKDRDQPPLVNGYSDFRAGADGTIHDEYTHILKKNPKPTRKEIPPKTSDEEYHELALVLDWTMTLPGERIVNLLSNALLAPEKSKHDKVASGGKNQGLEANSEDFSRILRVAKRNFIGELRTRNICERIVHSGNLQEVTNAISAGAPFIGLDDVDTSNGPPAGTDVRIPSFAFIEGGSAQPTGPEAEVRKLFGKAGWSFVDSHSPHRVVIIRCRAVFSAHAVTAVRELEPFWKEQIVEKWDARSRQDLEWRYMDGRPPISQLGYRMSAALTAIGLGVIRYAGGFYIDLPPAIIGQPARRVHFDESVDEIAIRLDRQNASEHLVDEIKKWIAENGRHATVQRLNSFAASFAGENALPLKWLGKPLADKTDTAGPKAAYRMRAFVDSVPDLWKEWLALVRIPPTLSYRRIGTPGDFGGGYLCNFCDAFLGSFDEEDNVRQMQRCPNKQCEALLQDPSGADLSSV